MSLRIAVSMIQINGKLTTHSGRTTNSSDLSGMKVWVIPQTRNLIQLRCLWVQRDTERVGEAGVINTSEMRTVVIMNSSLSVMYMFECVHVKTAS
jgi:hypothetical protein